MEELRARYQQQIKVLKIPAEEDRELVKLYDEMLEVHAVSYFMMQPPEVQHRWMALHDAHHMVLPTPHCLHMASGCARTHCSVHILAHTNTLRHTHAHTSATHVRASTHTHTAGALQSLVSGRHLRLERILRALQRQYWTH